MPVAPTYPGVYIEEVPSGVRTITGVATSITAFLGRTPRGPANAATVVTSYADFERRFGGLAADYPLTYAVRDFYQNGGSSAVIVRLFNPEDGTGAATFVLGGLKLQAASPGSWGNKLRASVELVTDAETKTAAGLKSGDTLFNLTVTDTAPRGAVERIMNLVVPANAADDDKVVRRPDKVLTQESNLVRWQGPWPAAADPARAAIIVSAGGDAVSAKSADATAADKALRAAKNTMVTATGAAPPAKLQEYTSTKKAFADATANEAAVKAKAGATAAEIATAVGNTATAKTAYDTAAGDVPDVVKAEQAVDAAAKTLDTASQALGTAESGMGGVDSKPVADLYVGSADAKTGMQALTTTDLFNLLCIPPDIPNGDAPLAVYQAAMQFCADHRAMLLVDAPAAWSANRETAATKAAAGLTDLGLTGVAARNAALYFPRVRASDPLRGGRVETFVPCGIIAGVMARTDTQRGVWKAPAGLDAALAGIVGLDAPLNDQENGLLNPLGVNVLRSFPVYGNVVWGARTLRGADQLADEYKYVPVRRLALYLEESLFRGTKWVVFEPNDEPLWSQIRLNVGAFMHNLFRQGAFQGTTPKDAYFVKCDSETTTQNDINLGIVNIVVGFAPLKPAEFVIIKLQQIAGKIDV
jgi:uncharacterized protein